MSDEIEAKPDRTRVTLDGQLASYWEREARRLDALADAARWNWAARGLRRRAARARAQGAQAAGRERARAPSSGNRGGGEA